MVEYSNLRKGGKFPPKNLNLEKPINMCLENVIKNRHIKFYDPSSITSMQKIGGTKFLKFGEKRAKSPQNSKKFWGGLKCLSMCMNGKGTPSLT